VHDKEDELQKEIAGLLNEPYEPVRRRCKSNSKKLHLFDKLKTERLAHENFPALFAGTGRIRTHLSEFGHFDGPVEPDRSAESNAPNSTGRVSLERTAPRCQPVQIAVSKRPKFSSHRLQPSFFQMQAI
jgi:hypothetical protein